MLQRGSPKTSCMPPKKLQARSLSLDRQERTITRESRTLSEIVSDGIAKIGLESRSNSGSRKSMSRENSGSSGNHRSLSRGSSSSSVKIVNPTYPFKVVAARFYHKKGWNFAPQNTIFVFDPSNALHVAEVDVKLRGIREKAEELDVNFETIEATGMAYEQIDAVGGASKEMLGIRFPPVDVEKSWMKETDRRKRKTGLSAAAK